MDINLENKDKIIALLMQGICPLCKKKCGFILNHISRIHGITANELKDTLLISRRSSFIPTEQSEKYRQIAIKNNLSENLIPGRKGNPALLTREKMKNITESHYKEHPEHREVIREKAKRPVVKISPNGEMKVYDSIINAAKANSLNSSTISRYVRHKRLDQYGNRWNYAERKENYEEG